MTMSTEVSIICPRPEVGEDEVYDSGGKVASEAGSDEAFVDGHDERGDVDYKEEEEEEEVVEVVEEEEGGETAVADDQAAGEAVDVPPTSNDDAEARDVVPTAKPDDAAGAEELSDSSGRFSDPGSSSVGRRCSLDESSQLLSGSFDASSSAAAAASSDASRSSTLSRGSSSSTAGSQQQRHVRLKLPTTTDVYSTMDSDTVPFINKGTIVRGSYQHRRVSVESSGTPTVKVNGNTVINGTHANRRMSSSSSSSSGGGTPQSRRRGSAAAAACVPKKFSHSYLRYQRRYSKHG